MVRRIQVFPHALSLQGIPSPHSIRASLGLPVRPWEVPWGVHQVQESQGLPTEKTSKLVLISVRLLKITSYNYCKPTIILYNFISWFTYEMNWFEAINFWDQALPHTWFFTTNIYGKHWSLREIYVTMRLLLIFWHANKSWFIVLNAF